MTLIATPCTIVRRTAGGDIDELGNPIATEETTETVCELQQKRSDEPVTEGEFGTSVWDCFFPSGTIIDTTDGVIVDPHGVFEVVGNPWHANQGSAAVNHVATTLKRTGDIEAS